jgi:hypothetical protein
VSDDEDMPPVRPTYQPCQGPGDSGFGCRQPAAPGGEAYDLHGRRLLKLCLWCLLGKERKAS